MKPTPLAFILFLATLLSLAVRVSAQTEPPPSLPPSEAAPTCEWLVGKWLCEEGSTKQERKLMVESFVAGEWRMAIFDEDIPDEGSDEWASHKLGEKLSIGNGIKETTKCTAENKLSISRALSFFATAKLLFTPDGEQAMSFANSVAAAGESGFAETYQCKRVASF